MAGTHSLRKFETEWPAGRWAGELLSAIREDLEDGIEHTPGSFFRGRLRVDLWESSFEYFKIEVDREILAKLINGASELQLIEERLERLGHWPNRS